MALPKSLTTVTTFSKILAMILFILLPFIGFYLGYNYYKNATISSSDNYINIPTLNATPTFSPTPVNCSKNSTYEKQNSDVDSWMIFKDIYNCFTIKYPQGWWGETAKIDGAASFIGNYNRSATSQRDLDHNRDHGNYDMQFTPTVTALNVPIVAGSIVVGSDETIHPSSIEHYMQLCCSKDGYREIKLDNGKGYVSNKHAEAVLKIGQDEFHISGGGFITASDLKLFEKIISTFKSIR